ncbi:MAG TPA: NUDIX hydrolase [Pyrinomonadaceae bacterium]|jgi:8-oxo-dGTP pyrophosphatase MutT (NUDIX family)|nr:NUDIX hydrolase [Pyrinomonadaceae bacterium]
MKRKHGPWTINESVRKYRGEFIEVIEDQVTQPDGGPGTYAVVRMKPGVSILALDGDGNVHLTTQFRYAKGADSIEATSGAIDEGEEPLEAARRELQEELGIEAGQWTELGVVDLDTSIVNCPAHLFLARDLSFTEQNQDDTEEIKPVRLSLGEAARKVMASEITHGPTCTLILKAAQLLQS